MGSTPYHHPPPESEVYNRGLNWGQSTYYTDGLNSILSQGCTLKMVFTVRILERMFIPRRMQEMRNLCC